MVGKLGEAVKLAGKILLYLLLLTPLLVYHFKASGELFHLGTPIGLASVALVSAAAYFLSFGPQNRVGLTVVTIILLGTLYIQVYVIKPSAEQIAAEDEFQRKIASEDDAYVAKNCRQWPEEERFKRYREIHEEIYKERGLKINE